MYAHLFSVRHVLSVVDNAKRRPIFQLLYSIRDGHVGLSFKLLSGDSDNSRIVQTYVLPKRLHSFCRGLANGNAYQMQTLPEILYQK